MDLYTNCTNKFKKQDPEFFNPKIMLVMEVDPEQPGVIKCTECNKLMIEFHFESEPHRKKMRTNHGIVRHEWNDFIGYWDDVSVDSDSSAGDAAQPV